MDNIRRLKIGIISLHQIAVRITAHPVINCNTKPTKQMKVSQIHSATLITNVAKNTVSHVEPLFRAAGRLPWSFPHYTSGRSLSQQLLAGSVEKRPQRLVHVGMWNYYMNNKAINGGIYRNRIFLTNLTECQIIQHIRLDELYFDDYIQLSTKFDYKYKTIKYFTKG